MSANKQMHGDTLHGVAVSGARDLRCYIAIGNRL